MPAGFYTVEMAEALTKIALQRKLPASGGRRGGRAVPIVASGLWHQVIQTVEQLYVFRPDGLHECLPIASLMTSVTAFLIASQIASLMTSVTAFLIASQIASLMTSVTAFLPDDLPNRLPECLACAPRYVQVHLL
jgi:hypothetical protein